jgi:hypothetical protein
MEFFAKTGGLMTTGTLKLSQEGVRQLAGTINRFAEESISLAHLDRKNGLAPRSWYTYLVVARELDAAPLIKLVQRKSAKQVKAARLTNG